MSQFTHLYEVGTIISLSFRVVSIQGTKRAWQSNSHVTSQSLTITIVFSSVQKQASTLHTYISVRVAIGCSRGNCATQRFKQHPQSHIATHLLDLDLGSFPLSETFSLKMKFLKYEDDPWP